MYTKDAIVFLNFGFGVFEDADYSWNQQPYLFILIATKNKTYRKAWRGTKNSHKEHSIIFSTKDPNLFLRLLNRFISLPKNLFFKGNKLQLNPKEFL